MVMSLPVRWIASLVSAPGGSLQERTTALALSVARRTVRRFGVAGIVASCGLLASAVFLLPGLAAPRAAQAGSGPLDVDGPTVAGSHSPTELMAFDSDRSGNFEIYTMNSDGSNLRQLTSDPRFDSWWARVSWDHQRILFYRTPNGVHDLDYSQTNLWMMNTDGTNQRLVRPAGTNGWYFQGHAEWSPDSTQIVMFGGSQSNPQIFITDTAGRVLRQVTNRGGMNLDPSWSPDGRTILFSGCPSYICFERNMEIYSVRATGGTLRRLTRNSIRDHDPYFSPDGRYIAWLAETAPGLYGAIGGWDIMRRRADGGEQVNLTNDRQLNGFPHWSEDSLRIYWHRWVVGESSHWSLWGMNADGSDPTQLSTGAESNDEYPDAY